MGAKPKSSGVTQSQANTTMTSSTNTRPNAIPKKQGKLKAPAAVKEIGNEKMQLSQKMTERRQKKVLILLLLEKR